MRIIPFADFHAPVEPLFREKHIIRINYFIALQNILFVHDCFHKKLPSCVNDYFTLVSDVHDHNTFANEMDPKSTLQCMVYTPYRKNVSYHGIFIHVILVVTLIISPEHSSRQEFPSI